MSDAVMLALITGLPATLAAAGALYAVIRNGNKSQRADEVIKDQNVTIVQQNDELKTQGDGIHDLVNGKLEKVKHELAAAVARIDEQTRTIERLEQLLAKVLAKPSAPEQS